MTINWYKISLGDNENVLKLIKVIDVKLHIYYKPLNCCCIVAMCRVQLLVTPWTVARQSPLFVRFPRQEYWSDCHFLLQGNLPDPRIKHMSSALANRFFTTEPRGKPTPLNCTP